MLATDPARQARAHSALGGFQLNEWGLEARYLATCGQDSTPAGDLLAHARGVINAWLATDPPPGPATAVPIPRQILQFWHAERLPPEVAHYMASWQSARGFAHHRFHQHDAARFLADRLGPDWVQAFRTPRDRAAACDFFRLCWLALEGGLYADADDRLVGDLPALLTRSAGTGLLLYQEPNGAVANNFIAARPGHPVIARAAVAARDALLRREYEGAWSATGPGLITRMVAAHIQACAGSKGPPDLRIIAQIDLVQSVQIHLALRYKTSASYWANSARPVLPDYRDLLMGAIAPGAATGGARRVRR
jgi:hypothetical protein